MADGVADGMKAARGRQVWRCDVSYIRIAECACAFVLRS